MVNLTAEENMHAACCVATRAACCTVERAAMYAQCVEVQLNHVDCLAMHVRANRMAMHVFVNCTAVFV